MLILLFVPDSYVVTPDLLCVFLPRAKQRGEVFSWFPSQKSIPQKKKREEKRDRGVFVILEIMLFVCYTSS